MNKFICFVFCILLSCSQQKNKINQEILVVNFDITEESRLGPNDLECLFIPLETNEECLLSLSFEDVQFYDDKIIIVNFHNNKARVLVFNDEGRFITQIGKIGLGPGEYHQPYKIHINKKENTITIADRHIRKLINYDLENYQYISSMSVPGSFENCVWLTEESILWCNSAGIDMGKRKWYYACITNKDMEVISTWHETKPSNYPIGYVSLFKHDNKAYTGLPFSPFIYQIDEENAIPVLKFSFGEQMLPPKSLVEDEKENSPAWQHRVITSDYIIAFHAHETSDCIGVSFYGKTFQRHLGFYDKKTGKTHAYKAEDFMKKFHLYGVYDIINTYGDYFVAKIEPRLLKKHSQQREDLRHIADNMTEEDNPVLCLFKFK